MTIINCPARSKEIAPSIKNRGIRAQIDFTLACGLPYEHHDGLGFDRGSDVEFNGLHISVKSYHFTLMSGPMCEGKTTLPEILDVFERRTCSDVFVYVTKGKAYMMNKAEFHDFVLRFCEVERESSNSDRQHTGSVKVRARRNERDMVKWFVSLT